MLNSQERIVIPVFLIVGLAMCGFGLKGAIEAKAFKERAFKADGVVVELERRRSRDSGYSYSPLVDYIDHKGLKQRYFSNTSSNPPAFHVGEHVVVLLDPNDLNYPYTAELESFWFLYGPYAVLGGMGSCFALIALVIFFVKRSKSEPNKSFKVDVSGAA